MAYNVTKEELERFIQKHGKNSSKMLSILGKGQQFVNAIESPVGAEIMGEVLIKLESLLELIINEKADAKNLAEYRVLREIANNWVNKINDHLNRVEEVKKS